VRPWPRVRAAAVDGICRILNTFWELVPAPTTAAFLAKLVDHLVGRCSLTISQPVLKAPMVSVLEAAI